MKTLYNERYILSREVSLLSRLKTAILLKFYDPLYWFTIASFGKSVQRKDRYLSVCAIFKNEARFLREWIEYHLLIGVERFYLYNNFSDDDYAAVLAPYIQNGVVSLIDWPVPQGQSAAYQDCFTRFGSETSWLACIDIDEFIVPKYETSMRDWLKPFERYPSIAIYWLVFGTSGKVSVPSDRLVAESYTVCWDRLDDVTKTVFNTSYEVYDFKNHHGFAGRLFGRMLPPVNEFKQPLWRTGSRWIKGKPYTIQINHYWSKSYESYVAKQNKGDVFFAAAPYNEQYFLKHETKNTSSDHAIFRFLMQLKLRLGVRD